MVDKGYLEDVDGLIIVELIGFGIYYVYKGFMLCKVIVIGKVVYSLVLFIGDNVIDILFEFYN